MANQAQFIRFVQRFVSAVAVAPIREVVRKREPEAKKPAAPAPAPARLAG